MRGWIIFLLSFILLLSGLLFIALPGQAQSDASDQPAMLAYGQTVSGNVADRLGEEWSWRGCAGDQVTVTMQSGTLNSYLELYGPTGRDPLAKDDNSGGGQNARLRYTLAQSGDYTLIATGARVRDRGPYSLTLTVAMSDGVTMPDSADQRILTADRPVGGRVADRLGEEWGFRGCAQDVVLLAMQSRQFDSYLELYGPEGRDALAKDDNSGGGKNARIANLALPATGDYTVIAAGAGVRDRGAYSLTLLITTPLTTAVGAGVTPVAPVAPATTPLCTVVIASLRMRGGPGTNYATIGALPQGAELVPRARNQSADWIEIQVRSSGGLGWVSGAAQYVRCNLTLSTLPLGVIPPTPIPPPPTATPLPTATPTRPPPPQPQLPQLPNPEGDVLQAPGDPGDLQGDLYALTPFRRDDNNEPVFGDLLSFELYVRDPRAPLDDPRFGIASVDFTLSCPNGGSYSNEETDRRYCAFEGGEPSCNVIRVRPGDFLPGSDCSIEPGNYNVSATANPTNDNRQAGNWNINFTLDIFGDTGDNNGSTDEPQELVLNLAQTGPGTTDSAIFGELVFQVEAYDPTVGSSDGDGIDTVDFWIEGPGGEIYSNTEESVRYCAFGGGEPDCNSSSVADLGLESGVTYTLRARANADDGRQKSESWQVTVQ